MEDGDGVVQHLDPDGQHLTALLGSGGRRPCSTVYARRRRERVVHALGGARTARARQLPRGASVAAARIHGRPLLANLLSLNEILEQYGFFLMDIKRTMIVNISKQHFFLKIPIPSIVFFGNRRF